MPQVPFVLGMSIVSPKLFGVQVWDYAGDKPAAPVYRDRGVPSANDPEVIWICRFGVQGNTKPEALRKINLIAREEARAMGFPCVIIRKEPHEQQYERTTGGQETTIVNKATGQIRRTVIPADLHLTIAMGNGLSKGQIHGHIYLERDPTDFGAVATNVRKIPDPRMRKYVPPGKEPVASEYWLVKGVQAIALDKTLVRGR